MHSWHYPAILLVCAIATTAAVAEDDATALQKRLNTEISRNIPLLRNELDQRKTLQPPSPALAQKNEQVKAELISLLRIAEGLQKYGSVHLQTEEVQMIGQEWQGVLRRMRALNITPQSSNERGREENGSRTLREVPRTGEVPLTSTSTTQTARTAEQSGGEGQQLGTGVTIKAITPSSILVPNQDTKLRVVGSGFTSDSRAYWNDQELDTKVESGTELVATVPSELLQKERAAGVAVGAGKVRSAAAQVTLQDYRQANASLPNAAALSLAYTYSVDVSRDHSDEGWKGGCTYGKGASQDSRVWKLSIALELLPPSGFDIINAGLALKDSHNALLPFISTQNDSVYVTSGARTYTGRMQQKLFQPRFVFERLTLNEVTDLLNVIEHDQTKIQSAFELASPSVKLFVIGNVDGQAADPNRLVTAVIGNFDPKKDDRNVFIASLEQRANQRGFFDSASGRRTFYALGPVQQAAVSPPTLNQESLTFLRGIVKQVANVTVDAAGLKHSPDDPTKLQTNITPATPLLIDTECIQVSFAPGLQNGTVQPAGKFRARFSYIPEDGKVVFRFRSEGEGAQNDNRFQRISGTGELTALTGNFGGGWNMTGGAVTSYSYSRNLGVGVSEWSSGGQFQIQTPVLTLAPTRGGAQQKPTFTFEGVASGGNGGPVEQTAFTARGKFAYTFQPTTRVFADFVANGGWSDQPRFATRKQFAYGSTQLRINVTPLWDLLANYECGRKDPDYRKFCGWQTGITAVTGR